MNKEVNFEIAKLLKEKGFSWECRHFYSKSKYDKEFYLKTGTEYESDRDCIWDWNLNGGKSGMLSKIIPYPNDSDAIYYSAPTISEVVVWLYEKHGIWISVDTDINGKFRQILRKHNSNDRAWEVKNTFSISEYYSSPAESYEAGIKHSLENLL